VDYDNDFIIYEGIFIKGSLNGIARHLSYSKDTQQVAMVCVKFKDYMINGIGTCKELNTSDKTRTISDYPGYFKNNERDVIERLILRHIGDYFGEFRDGKAHGKGILTLADGSIKKGMFKDDHF
jgi:hypothetical protein